jgi:hypothetical protein
VRLVAPLHRPTYLHLVRPPGSTRVASGRAGPSRRSQSRRVRRHGPRGPAWQEPGRWPVWPNWSAGRAMTTSDVRGSRPCTGRGSGRGIRGHGRNPARALAPPRRLAGRQVDVVKVPEARPLTPNHYCGIEGSGFWHKENLREAEGGGAGQVRDRQDVVHSKSASKQSTKHSKTAAKRRKQESAKFGAVRVAGRAC